MFFSNIQIENSALNYSVDAVGVIKLRRRGQLSGIEEDRETAFSPQESLNLRLAARNGKACAWNGV